MSKKVLHAFVTLPAKLTFTVKIFFELIPHSFCMVGWIVAMPQHCQRQQVFGGSTIISPESGTISLVDGLMVSITQGGT